MNTDQVRVLKAFCHERIQALCTVFHLSANDVLESS